MVPLLATELAPPTLSWGGKVYKDPFLIQVGTSAYDSRVNLTPLPNVKENIDAIAQKFEGWYGKEWSKEKSKEILDCSWFGGPVSLEGYIGEIADDISNGKPACDGIIIVAMGHTRGDQFVADDNNTFGWPISLRELVHILISVSKIFDENSGEIVWPDTLLVDMTQPISEDVSMCFEEQPFGPYDDSQKQALRDALTHLPIVHDPLFGERFLSLPPSKLSSNPSHIDLTTTFQKADFSRKIFILRWYYKLLPLMPPPRYVIVSASFLLGVLLFIRKWSSRGAVQNNQCFPGAVRR